MISPVFQDYLLHGTPSPPPERHSLRAGPLSALFEAGDLRYIRLGKREVIRRIYAAVRDQNWNTVPGEISALEIKTSEEGFAIRYSCAHRAPGIHFAWNAEIEGNGDGGIRFGFQGQAECTFLRNRIGLCVLHPIRECASAACRATYTNGASKDLQFPDLIAAEQPVKGLHDLSGLAHEIEPGVWAELRFTGDEFETEDQRNWIDASFKTYGTPLRVPFPLEIRAGTAVRQEVRLNLSGRKIEALAPAARAPHVAPRERTIRISMASAKPQKMPSLGLEVASHSEELADQEIQRLRTLRVRHLRTDLKLWEEDWRARLRRAARQADQLDARLEVALHFDEAPIPEAQRAVEVLREHRSRMTRMLVFQRGQKSTTRPVLEAARQHLGGLEVPIGAGTDADLYQLNLQRPPPEADFICWSMNPQVHASDNTSISETPEAAAHQVTSVKRYFPGRPAVISPVTLKPRFNPNVTGPEAAVPPGHLPPQVDPRQLSLFGAVWTLSMIQSIATAGADSITLFETTGWRGVMETIAGSSEPELFPSVPGAVFPLYHVLADLGEFADGVLVRTECDEPQTVASLLMEEVGRARWILANRSSCDRRVHLPRFGEGAVSRCLNLSTVGNAMAHPELFRRQNSPCPSTEFVLPPHALVTIDFVPVEFIPSKQIPSDPL